MQTKGLVVAGLAGGSGKSVVSVGLTAYFTGRGYTVVPFKKGPDYIDAGWLALAAGKNCYNLDPYLMPVEAIHASFQRQSQGADIVVVEGNRGIYDGVNSTGGYSTAELAVLLRLPVLLVVNCTKTTRTAAAMVLGCKMLDTRLNICGVILNNIATERQRKIVTRAVEEITGIPVLGIVPRMTRDIFPMRHLGMIPHQEYPGSPPSVITFLAEIIESNVRAQEVEKIMAPLSSQTPALARSFNVGRGGNGVKIGVIQDAAFQFYYAENLEALEAAGARLVSINALHDKSLPDIDGLYIGGGFPETSARELAANRKFRSLVKVAAQNGLPIYAECGGLIYLGESIVLDGEEHPLAGVFPVRFGMSAKPQAHGYSVFEVDRQNPFYALQTTIKGHEFRYSTVLEWRGGPEDLVFKMRRGKGFSDGRDGLLYNNVVALYTHIHAEGTPQWAHEFIKVCRNNKEEVSR